VFRTLADNHIEHCSRVGNLFVHEVNAPFEIREHEGKERIVDVSRRKDIVMSVAEKSIPEIAVCRLDTVVASPESSTTRAVPVSPTKQNKPTILSVAAPPKSPASQAGPVSTEPSRGVAATSTAKIEQKPMLDRISSAFLTLTEPAPPAASHVVTSAPKATPKAPK